MKISREQAIFDEMFKRSKELGFKTYAIKPMNEVNYPFVEFEDSHTTFNATKMSVKGEVTLNISVWGLATTRRVVTEIGAQLFEQAMVLKESTGYFWAFNPEGSDIQVLDDMTTNTALKRVLLTLKFKER